MKSWQHAQLLSLARRMITLEQQAQRAEARFEHARADDIWSRREIIQWQRSLLLRDIWDAERA